MTLNFYFFSMTSRLILVREVFDAVYTDGARKNRDATEWVTSVSCRTFWDRTNMVLGRRDFRPLLPARPLVSRDTLRERCGFKESLTTRVEWFGFTYLQSVTAVFYPLLLRVPVTGDNNYSYSGFNQHRDGNNSKGLSRVNGSSVPTCATALSCSTSMIASL